MTRDIVDIEKLKEEEEQKLTRLDELLDKKERSEEDKKEIDELKKFRSAAHQKRFDILTSQNKEKEFLLKKEREEAEALRRENEELKKKKEEPRRSLAEEFIEIDGEKYYTDETLVRMVKNGEMDDAKAWKLQRERDNAESADRAYKRLKKDQEGQSIEREKAEDVAWVNEHYPQFNKNHPDFNESDPLYVEATKMWLKGYRSNPRGLSESIKDAKRMLQIKDKNIDVSDDFSVNNSRSGGRQVSSETKKVEFSEYEIETAKRMYCRGDVLNPATGRPYTENEAIAKFKKSKELRLKK